MCKNWFKPKIDTSAQDFAQQEAVRTRDREAARQQRIATGLDSIANIFEGRGSHEGIEPLLASRRQAQESFYLPQLDDQYADAKDELTFALSRAGLLTSTAAGEKAADLADNFALQRGGILSDIDADIASTRSRLRQQRSALESGVRASGDASGYINSALATIGDFTAEQPTLSPLANLLAGAAQGIGAAKTGYDVGQIKKKADPFSSGYGRNVR